MVQQDLHQKLQQISEQVQVARRNVLQAQGSDEQLHEQALQQLRQVEKELQNAKKQAGIEATENPQFQQAYEQLHDLRQQVQEARENNNNGL